MHKDNRSDRTTAANGFRLVSKLNKRSRIKRLLLFSGIFIEPSVF